MPGVSTSLLFAGLLAGDPHNGKFTLEEAVSGVPGPAGGPLVAMIHTTMGELTCKLASREAPKVVANFVGLARGARASFDPKAKKWGRPAFYHQGTFNKVVPGGLIWGGDPVGDGTGGPGYRLTAADPPRKRPPGKTGLLAAVGGDGPGVHGSQFVITTTPGAALGPRDVIFGQCGPQSVIDAIAAVPRDARDRPVNPVELHAVEVQHEGYESPGVVGVLNDSDGDGQRDALIGKDGAAAEPSGPPPPKLEFGKVTMQGARPSDMVQSVASTLMRIRLPICYDQARKRRPRPTGTLIVRLTIRADGLVKQAEKAGGTLDDRDFVTCALNGFRALEFPAIPEKGVSIATLAVTVSAK